MGLDDLARRLVGTPERVEPPAVGSRLQVNGPAARLTTRGNDVRVLSPVDGTVLEVRGEGAGFTLRVDPGAAPELRHLLSGTEARAWGLRELERLQWALGPSELGAALADGGELVAGRWRGRCRATATTRCSGRCSSSRSGLGRTRAAGLHVPVPRRPSRRAPRDFNHDAAQKAAFRLDTDNKPCAKRR